MAFDQEGKLWQQSQAQDFDSSFARALAASVGTLNGQVVHFSQDNCQCNPVAQAHLDSVAALADQQGFGNAQVKLAKDSAITQYIPATPAIAVFDQVGELVYLGPYSAGYSCSVGDGIVESYLTGEVKKAPEAMVLTNTEGCYCPI